MTTRVAAASYALDPFADWSDADRKIRPWVAEAAKSGANLLVFPEYAGLEFATLGDPDAARDPTKLPEALAPALGDIHRFWSDIASTFGVYILSGSLPVRQSDQTVVNRAGLFAPSGARLDQDKIIPTPFERRECGISGGGPLNVVTTPFGTLAVLICYDAEFPLLARRAIEAGAEILLVPSATESCAGYSRVRIGAMARALEGQCAVVHAPLVGEAEWCPVVDVNRGAGAIYVPPDLGFPETGILAEGPMDRAQWVYADVDIDALRRIRATGQVQTVAHWPEQMQGHASAPINQVSLS